MELICSQEHQLLKQAIDHDSSSLISIKDRDVERDAPIKGPSAHVIITFCLTLSALTQKNGICF